MYAELGEAVNDDRYRRAAWAMNDDSFANFYRPQRGLLLERIAQDNRELPAPLGTTVNPGHVIEDMWFTIHIARDAIAAGRDVAKWQQRIALACQIIRRHIEAGWDKEFGGLFLAIDADGRADVDYKFADTKVWWPQTEALYATLLAHELTGEPWAMQWHRKVLDWSLAHYPVKVYGEWTQKLDRQGRPITEVVALPVKDPFHLPRAVIYCIDMLERMTSK
jgi:N-acylglucosamine 2-epimerase